MNGTNDRNRAAQTVGRHTAGATRRPAPAQRTATAAGRAGAAPQPRRTAGPKAKPAAGFDAGQALDGLKAIAGRAGDGLKRGLSALRGSGKAGGARKRGESLLRSRFYRVYFALLALAVIGIVAGTVWLNGLLKDYESAQPIYVAREIGKVFEAEDFAALYAMDSSAQDIANGDQAFYEQTMRDLVAGKEISWSKAFSPDEAHEQRYTVTVGSDRFATFTLVPSGETTPRGNTLWKLGTVDTNVVTQTELDETLGERIEYRVTAPEGYAVAVDGDTLTRESAVRTGITMLPNGFLPSGVSETPRTEYRFLSRSERPDIAVTDQSGAAQALREDGENAWSCGPEENAAFREQYSGGIAKIAEQLAKFTSGDVSRSAMQRNVASDSPAYDIIKKFSNYWAPTHKEVEFSNMAVTDCYFWSDSCFTCHVTFDFLLRTRRGTEMTYPTAYTFCFIKRGGGAKLYNLQMN